MTEPREDLLHTVDECESARERMGLKIVVKSKILVEKRIRGRGEKFRAIGEEMDQFKYDDRYGWET